jgi:hypothetical protein
MAQLTPSREAPRASKVVSQSARVNCRAALTPQIAVTTLPIPMIVWRSDERLELLER